MHPVHPPSAPARHLWIWPLALACAAATGALACGDGGDSGPAPKSVYGPTSRETVNEYKRNREDGSLLTITSEVVGEIALPTGTFQRTRLGEFSPAAPSGIEAWVSFPNPQTLTIAGGEVWSQQTLPSPNPADSSARIELATPITVDLTPALGEPQRLDGEVNVDILGTQVALEITGSFTLVSDDVTVMTGAGALHGCRHYTGSGKAEGNELLALLGADEASGELWQHPNLGFVRAVASVPGRPDYVFDFTGTTEYGRATSGTNRIQGMRVLRTLEKFELSTYDVHGALDADKDTHAKMMIEARYLEEDLARSSNRPPIVTDFGTVFGTFPHFLVESPLSFFHPEENGQGFTYWIGYVDQAAKNEPSNGIVYHVTARVPDYGTNPVRVTSRIVYQLYTP